MGVLRKVRVLVYLATVYWGLEVRADVCPHANSLVSLSPSGPAPNQGTQTRPQPISDAVMGTWCVPPPAPDLVSWGWVLFFSRACQSASCLLSESHLWAGAEWEGHLFTKAGLVVASGIQVLHGQKALWRSLGSVSKLYG